MRLFPRALGACLLLLTVGLGCDSVTPIAPADAVLTITVNPTRITSEGEAVITVLARKTDGFPVNEGTEITFSTDLGRLSPEVTFTDEQGRALTTLFGNGEVGLATVSAVSGSIEITAETAVQIGSVPNSLEFIVNPTSVNYRRVNNQRNFRMTASVVDDLGDQLAGATVRFDTEIGTLESRGNPLETNQMGRARDTVSVKTDDLERQGREFGSFFVSVTVTGGDAEGLVELFEEQEIFIFGFPGDILLETGQSSIPTGGGTIQLVATVLDDESRVLEGAGVQFTSTAGRVASLGGVVTTDSSGQAFDFLEVNDTDLAALGANTVTATATVEGAGGVELVSTAVLNVQGTPPIAGFTVALACNDATFTNTTTPASTPADPVEYTWDFGDGSPLLLTNVQTAVSHTYPSVNASYTATLTATNTFGVDMVSNPVLVDLNITPAFTAVPMAGMVVSFDASASVVPDPAATYTWDFGDGTSGTGVTTSNTYAAAGPVTVTLTVSACGNTAMTSQSVTVAP